VDDYFFDVLRDQKQINLPAARMDDIDEQIMNLARARFPG
jgi:type I restriction enzyme R subunit